MRKQRMAARTKLSNGISGTSSRGKRKQPVKRERKPAKRAQPLSAVEQLRQRIDTNLVTRGRIVIIGLGGIGLWLVRGVATFLAGLISGDGTGRQLELLLCDGDAFQPENGYRMDIPDFGNKAAVVGRELLERIQTPHVIVRWRSEYASPTNIHELILNKDCVLLACDNHKTRSLVGEFCAGGTLEDVVLISGGNDGVEHGLNGTYGNVQVYVRQRGSDLTAPLARFHPEIAHPVDKSPDELSCLEQVAGAPQLALANMAVASAMCSALLRLMMPVAGERMYDEVALDVLEAVNTPHWISGPQQIER
jgi:hypothetical protein